MNQEINFFMALYEYMKTFMSRLLVPDKIPSDRGYVKVIVTDSTFLVFYYSLFDIKCSKHAK